MQLVGDTQSDSPLLSVCPFQRLPITDVSCLFRLLDHFRQLAQPAEYTVPSALHAHRHLHDEDAVFNHGRAMWNHQWHRVENGPIRVDRHTEYPTARHASFLPGTLSLGYNTLIVPLVPL
jgi:hypothetical protein